MPENSPASAPIPLGEFRLDLARAELRGPDDQLVPLRRQALDVLLLLAEQAGHVVGKETLMRRVWPNVIVGDDSLVQTIAEIRRVLNDREHRLVRTVARRGYLLLPTSFVPPAAMLEPIPAETPTLVPALVPAPIAVATTEETTNTRPGRSRSQRLAVGVAIVATLLVVAGLGIGFGFQNGEDRLRGERQPFELAGAGVDLAPTPSAATPSASLLNPSPTPSATPSSLPSPIRSLIVLPIRDESGIAEQGWFADALTSDLTSALAAFRDVMVIGRGTAARYPGTADPRDVARELGVRFVIQGSVRRDGQRVRLDLAMVDGVSGVQQWSQQFDIDRGQLASSIDDIKGGLAKTLLIELGHSVGVLTDRMEPDQVEADDLAMRGLSVYLRGLSPVSFGEAARLFDEAVVRDPKSVRGLAGISLVNMMSVVMNWQPDRGAAIQRAESALARLEVVDTNGQLTLLARAGLTNLRADWEGLLAIAEELLARYPSDPTSHHHRCSALLRLGYFAESATSCERAIRISPRDSRVAIWQGLIAMTHFMRSEPAQAAEYARRSVMANARIPFYQLLLAASLVENGSEGEARLVVDDFKVRHADFAPAVIPTLWVGTHPVFVARRDRIVAVATELLAR